MKDQEYRNEIALQMKRVKPKSKIQESQDTHQLLQLRSKLGNKNMVQFMTNTGDMEKASVNPLFEGARDYDHHRIMEEPLGGMTYHHVISKEILMNFFNKLKTSGDLDAIKGGVNSLINTAVTSSREGLGDFEHESTTFETSDGTAISSNDIKGAYDNIASDQAFDQDAGSALEAIFQWWPANLHHGPSDRINPDGKGYNKDIDDGGEGFEESSKYVVKPSRYKALANINKAIEEYMDFSGSGKAKTKLLRKLNGSILSVSSETSVQRYDPKKWYYDDKLKKYRIDAN